MKGSRGKILFLNATRPGRDTSTAPHSPAPTDHAEPEKVPGAAMSLAQLALELVLPTTCRLCDRCLPTGSDFCDICLQKLESSRAQMRSACPRCGRPARSLIASIKAVSSVSDGSAVKAQVGGAAEKQLACGRADCEKFHFDACFPLWSYVGVVQETVVASKYGSQIALCDALGRRLGLEWISMQDELAAHHADSLRGTIPSVLPANPSSGPGCLPASAPTTGASSARSSAGRTTARPSPQAPESQNPAANAPQKSISHDIGPDFPEWVCPVPSHLLRRVQRSGGGSRPLARAMCRVLSARCTNVRYRELVVTARRIRKQAWQNAKERAENVRGAYRLARPISNGFQIPSLRGRHILLVDDVMTTGATANEIAAQLKLAGARRVTVAVVARALAD